VKSLPTLRRFAAPGFAVFASVLFLRVAVLTRLTGSAFLLPSRGDMHFYNDWAQRILRGAITDHLAFYGLPLYAYVLAFFYKIFGYNPFIPGLFQALLDAGTAVLIYQITLLISQERVAFTTGSTSRVWSWVAANQSKLIGLVAALGWALFVPAQAYSAILMPTVWLVFVFWFVVWRIVKSESAPTPRECLFLGLLIGVTAMGVATILFLFPLVAAALLLKSGVNGKHSRTRTLSVSVAALLLGMTVGTSPCWIHNYFVARDPVFLSAHSGINFWIGNNPDANGYTRFPPGLRAGQAAMLQDSIASAEAVAGRPLKRAEVSAYWSAKAKDYIAHHFGQWLRLLLIKLRNVWSAFQYDDLSIITNLREQGVLPPGINFGLVAAFAIPGMFLGWRIAPRSRWITAAIVLHIAALLTVFITERYRLPLVPGLLIFAAFGLALFWRSFVVRDFRLLTTYLVLLVAAAIFVSWPQRDPSLWALDAYNSGWQALESNDLPLAEKKLALAYAYVPNNAETNFAVGNLRFAQDQRQAAAGWYGRALQIDPKHKGALNNLGVIALDANDLPSAKRFFEQALKQDPRSGKTHYLLAKTLKMIGALPEATAEIARAIEIDPNQQEFLDLKRAIDRDR